MSQIQHRLVSPGWRRVRGFQVFFLMNWRDQDRASSSLLYEMKEARWESLYRPFARQMVAATPSELYDRAVLIPLPSSTGRLHSRLLAQSLSALTGADVVDALHLKEAVRQPGKRRVERMKRQMEVESTVEKLHSYTTVLFIDDVITTGSTMTAAKVALGLRKGVYGLTLFSRALSTKFASL